MAISKRAGLKTKIVTANTGSVYVRHMHRQTSTTSYLLLLEM